MTNEDGIGFVSQTAASVESFYAPSLQPKPSGISAGEKRFLVRMSADQSATPLEVILNWTALLKRKPDYAGASSFPDSLAAFLTSTKQGKNLPIANRTIRDTMPIR